MTAERRDYALLLAAAALWGCATAPLNLLAVVLRDAGQSDQAIGVIFASSTVAVVIGTIVSGWLISRIGAARTFWVGSALALLAIGILPFAVTSAAFATSAKIIQGLGFGLSLPGGVLYARAQAGPADRIYYVAMFTSMFLAPVAIGPAIGEWELRHYGQGVFFGSAIVPMICSVWLAGRLRRDQIVPVENSGYLRLLRDRSIWLPNLAVLHSGIAYGFVVSFLPLMLVDTGILVAAFFTPFAVALIAVRFVLLRYLRLPPPIVTALGLLASAGGLAILATTLWAQPISTGITALVATGLAGCCMSFGYSVLHPTTTEWVARQFAAAASARPVALINTSFHVGSIIGVQLTAASVMVIGWFGVVTMLGAMITLLFLIIAGGVVVGNLRVAQHG